MSDLINNGLATTMWHGISHDYLLSMCAKATLDEAACMSNAASLMVAGECSNDEFDAACAVLAAVERRICAEWEAIHGEPIRNRNGLILSGIHPALNPALYAEAIANIERTKVTP